MSGFAVGRAYVEIAPSTKGLHRALTAEFRKQGAAAGVSFRQAFDKVVGTGAVSVDVGADTGAARAEIAALTSQVDGQNVSIDVDADTTRARAEMSALDRSATGATSSLSGLMVAGIALGPAIVPAAGAAAVALGALGSAAMSAAGGAGVMVLAFQGIPSALKAVSGAQATAGASAEVQAAAQQKAAAAMESLSPAGRDFVRFMLDAKSGLKGLRDQAAEGFLPGLQRGLEQAGKALSPFQGAIGTVSRALGGMASSAGKALNTPFWQKFLDTASSEMPANLRLLGSALGNIVEGFAGLGVAMRPLTTKFLDGLVSLTDQFAKFGTGRTGGVQQFVGWLARVGPRVADMFGQLVKFVGRFFIAVAPAGLVVVDAIRSLARWLNSLPIDVIQDLAIAFGGLVLAVKAGQIAMAAFNFVASLNPFGMIVIAIVAVVGALVLLYRRSETARRYMDAAWAGIKRAVAVVAEWLTKTALPKISAALTALGRGAMWLWRNAIGPAFRAIGRVVSWLWSKVVRPYVGFMVRYWTTLAKAGLWLWRNALGPAFRAIGRIIGWLWGKIVRPYFGMMVRQFRVAGRVIGWLWSHAAKPTFTWIGNKARWLWGKAIKPAFDSIRRGASRIVGAFRAAKDGVGRVWGGLKSAVAGPIRAVLGFIQNNFIAPLNSLLAKAGIKFRIPSIDLDAIDRTVSSRTGLKQGGQSKSRDILDRGYAAGGWTGSGSKYQLAGVVHADEYVIRKESQNDLRRKAPGLLDALNRYGAGALGYAMGGKVAGLNPEFLKRLSRWNEALNNVYRVSSGFRSIAEQTALWNASDKSGRMVARPGGSKHNFGIAADLAPGTTPGARALAGKYGLIFPMSYEPWHIEALGLKGSRAGYADGSGGGMIGDWLRGKARGLISKLPGQGFVAELAKGIFRKAVNGFIGRAMGWDAQSIGSLPSGAGAGAGVQRWASIVRKALWMTGQPSSLVGTVLRRMAQESGGNPNAVNNRDSNAAAGDPSKGLMQVIGSTFRAYAHPSHNRDIFDPLSNVLASMRYAVARYGSLSAAYNRAGGYADGGLVKPLLFDGGGYLPTGVSAVINKTGKPEPLARTDRMIIPNVTVYIGERELTDIVRVELDGADAQRDLHAYMGKVGR